MEDFKIKPENIKSDKGSHYMNMKDNINNHKGFKDYNL